MSVQVDAGGCGLAVTGMDQVVQLGEFLIWGVLGSAAFLLFLKAATGRINLRGLLKAKDDGAGISLARIQMLFLTLISAFGYLGLATEKLVTCMPGACSLPDPPTELLLLLGGSHGAYLGAKGLIEGGWLESLRGGQQ